MPWIVPRTSVNSLRIHYSVNLHGITEVALDLDSGGMGSWLWQGWASVVHHTCVLLFLGTQSPFSRLSCS